MLTTGLELAFLSYSCPHLGKFAQAFFTFKLTTLQSDLLTDNSSFRTSWGSADRGMARHYAQLIYDVKCNVARSMKNDQGTALNGSRTCENVAAPPASIRLCVRAAGFTAKGITSWIVRHPGIAPSPLGAVGERSLISSCLPYTCLTSLQGLFGPLVLQIYLQHLSRL
jgi:hypothetical protein